MAKASVNLGARGQVYHHDFSMMVENDPEVRVVKCKRKMRGMLYYYELQKVPISNVELPKVEMSDAELP